MYQRKNKPLKGRLFNFRGLGSTDELDEVTILPHLVTSAPKTPPTEYDNMPVIEVSGTKISWWAWAIGGVLAASVIFKR